MAISLVEASKLSQDMLQKGVIETMIRNSAVLEVLPFMDVVGNAYAYNLVDELPSVGFRDVNEGYVESGSDFTQKSDRLYMLGGDVDVDKFVAETRGNINDQRAIQTELKSKSVAEEFTKTFFHGDSVQNPKQFDGIQKRLVPSQIINVEDTVNGTLTLNDLNKLIDTVPYGADALFLSKSTRRIIMNLLQTQNHYIEVGQDAFGRPVTHYAGVPLRVVEDSLLPKDEVEGNKIFAVKFGAMTDVCGLQHGSIRVTDIGELETKPALRTRIEWYVGLACFRNGSIAVLKGIKA